MNTITIFSAIGGLIFGLVIAFINGQISKKTASQDSVVGVMGGNSARLLLDIAALAIGYFVSKKTGLPAAAILVSIAVGLSVGGMFFLKMLTKQMKKDAESETEKKES